MEDRLIGKHAVTEAIKSGRTINKVSLQRDLNQAAIRPLLRLLDEHAIVYNWVDKAKLDALAEHHQGVIAFVAATEYAAWQDFAQGGLILMLDGITDPHNLGAIIRSAYSFGAEGIIIPKRRSASVDAVVHKASAGAASHLPVARVSNLNFVLEELKKRGYWIYGADAHNASDLAGVDFSPASVIVIGSEDQGLSQQVKKKCDVLFKIETTRFESLNASVAAGISCYGYRLAQKSGK